MAKTPDTLYHYTIGPKLDLIAKARRLEPRGFGMAASSREKPVLWWSENPLWEPTANKVMSRDNGRTFFRPSLPELQESAGAYRFALDFRKPDGLHAVGIKPIPWSRIPLVAKIDPKDVAILLKRGMDLGSTPVHWWGTLEPVPLSLQASGALRLETLEKAEPGNPTSWQPITMEEALDRLTTLGRIKMTTVTATPQARGV